MVSVGEPINHEAWEWLHKVVGDGRCTLVDTWWQTGECPRGVVRTGLGTSQGLEEGRFMFSGDCDGTHQARVPSAHSWGGVDSEVKPGSREHVMLSWALVSSASYSLCVSPRVRTLCGDTLGQVA